MTTKIDLLAAFRNTPGAKVSGEAEIDLDAGTRHVAEAVADRLRNTLERGEQPDGSAMPLNSKGLPRGTGGTGRLAAGLHAVETSPGVYAVRASPDREDAFAAVYADGGIDVTPQGMMESDEIKTALARAAATIVGDE